jgi:hypothetical protein
MHLEKMNEVQFEEIFSSWFAFKRVNMDIEEWCLQGCYAVWLL